MDNGNGHGKQQGTGRFGLPNWSTLKMLHTRVQQLVSLPEFIAFAAGHATTRPDCNESRRDGEINTRGAAGVHDVKYICQKDTSNAYAWRGQVTTPAGTGVANRVAYWTGAETLGSDADLVWDPTGNALGIGATSPAFPLDIQGTGDSITVARFVASALGSAFRFRKSRNAAVGSHTIVQSGDALGTILFQGSNGTSFDNAAAIVGNVDGTPGSSNDMPGRLVFQTTPDGSSTLAEAFRIGQNKDALGRGAIRSDSATAGIGYATGAGGTVTQNTSKSTGVTINTVCGQITMNNATLNSGNRVTFTVTNSVVAATDGALAWHANTGTTGGYEVECNNFTAGTFDITVRNATAGNLSEAIVLGFVVIKAVSA